ncbi:ubiquitin carboxyl-terminal hydrolase 10-A isoform X1 [Bradysia coprophila]|uniref:ubiquitin carboxyl-terminal hydrolase 10-A isoform X1 n=2 Tax=Bradysia coprophila TaxID=38358 RepID=UPI00187DBE12|nr:ubiquitin carboxyl-terminal hydrolase 10-A isoform X1 [Bradysia coprophila]
MDHCKSKQPDQYEFLDLSDVNDDERTRLSTALQPINAASSALLNNDVNQIVTAGIQFAPQYEYIQSNLNWPAVPYDDIHQQYPQLSYNTSVNLVDSKENKNMTPHTTVSHQQPSATSNNQQQQQQPPPTAPQQQSAQNPIQSGPPQNANIPSHIAQQAAQQHLYSQPPPNFVPHSGGMYQILPQGMPNVYVNNVTANVNLHGYMSHAPMQHYMSANAPPFIPADMQQQQQQQQQQAVPSMHEQQQPQASGTNSYVRGGGIRGRGRGRGGNSGSGTTRREYLRQQNTQEVQQPVLDQQSMLQHGNFIYYPYFAPQHMQVGMPSAQHATGSLTGQPLYASNNMMPTTYIPAHQIYGYPNVVYPSMVPPDYSMMEGKVDESPENAMQQMWHHIPIEYADHQQIEHQMHQQHPEEFMQQEEMDEYNYNQNIDHNTPHMLSPMYKEDQPYQQMHLSPEFVPQPLVHLSPQQMIEVQPQQQHLQQQQAVAAQQAQQQQQIQQPFNETVSGNEYDSTNNQDGNNVDAATVALPNQHGNDYHKSIDSFNNNVQDKNMPPVENSQPRIIPSDGVKVPVVTTINNNNSLKGSNSNTSSSDNSNSGSGISSGGCDNKSVESTSVVPKSVQLNSVQAQPPAVISTADLNKLATSVSEKLIIKSDHGPLKPTSTGPWNKKNTTSVAVSAVPISYPPPPFQTTNTRNTDSTSSTNHKPTVPKSDNTLTKETTKDTTDISSEQLQKPISVNASTSNTYQSSIESRSVKVEVIPRSDNSSSVVNSSDSVLSSTKSIVKDEATASTQNPIQSPTIASLNNEPSTAATPAAPPTWAGLFAAKPGYATRTHSESISRKPVAKVSPFETSLNNAPQNNFSFEGQLSYSAASSQGLPTPSSNVSLGTGAHKKTVTVAPSKATIAPQGDESSLKMGEFFQKYKVDNSSVSLRPRGLINRSNNCYMNASLQALVACPPFYNLMRSIPLQPVVLRSKTNTPTVDAMVELINEFSHLPPGARLTQHKKSHKKEDVAYDLVSDQPFEPTGIYKLWNSARPENEGRQEDAEEFLGFLLNKLNDEMLELKKLVEKPAVAEPQQSVANGDVNGETADDGDEWQLIGNKNKGSITRSADFGRTPLSDIFRGELRSRLQREGDHSTDIMQPFFTLQLNIEKAASVKEALENFVGKDQVDGVTCSKTNQEVMAWQQMTLEKLPVVLVLHLKWFDYKLDGCTKILKTVEFPIELKIDSKIISSKKYSQKQKQYKLFAVVYHDGKEASKGHYITDAFHCGYLCWLRYDDSSVKVINESSVLHPRVPRVPYLLYYRRSDTIGQPSNHK